jgi:hypothetical protein
MPPDFSNAGVAVVRYHKLKCSSRPNRGPSAAPQPLDGGSAQARTVSELR